MIHSSSVAMVKADFIQKEIELVQEENCENCENI